MDKDTIQQIRDWAEAAANRLPYGKDNVVFSGVEIMELLDHLASKEAEVERLNKEHGEWQTEIEYRLEQAEIRVQRAETAKAEVDAQREELGRLREALEFYAEENPVAIEDDNGEIARRALARQSELAGEFTGKIETAKLYPKALTPDEIFNDYLEGKDG